MRKLENQMIPMRDGVHLATDLYLPDREGSYPLILLRTPYNKEGIVREPLYDQFPRFIANGYVVAVQDCRGTLNSEGVIDINGKNEHYDGYDTVEFLATQPYCNGKVGMFGLSYFGFTQVAAAAQNPPHLEALCPFMCTSLASFGTNRMQSVSAFHVAWAYGQLLEHPDEYFPDHAFREKIVPVLKENMTKLGEYSRILPMNENPAALIPDVPMLGDYIALTEGVEDKEFWDSIHSPMDYDNIHSAMLHGTGWYDVAMSSTVDNFVASRNSSDEYTRENARLLIGPWTHGGILPNEIDGIDYGAENSGQAQDVAGIMLSWFDRYLKGEDKDCFEGRVRYFILNSNKWMTSSEWPPVESKNRKLYLTASGTLAGEAGDESSMQLTYDPSNPVPSDHRDDQGRTMNADWSFAGERSDVLCFCSDIFSADTDLAGDIKAVICASTDVPDTDFAVRVTDIYPDGYERQICAGLVRARHRNGLFRNDFLEPGKRERFEIMAGHVGYCVKAGHRIGLQLMGSLFPAFNRNLNTKEAPSLGRDYVTAHDEICTGGENASYIEIPVI